MENMSVNTIFNVDYEKNLFVFKIVDLSCAEIPPFPG